VTDVAAQSVPTLDVPTYLLFVLPVVSLVGGQLQLLYRFSRIGGGPGTYRQAIRQRKKQYRSILAMDAIAGVLAVSAVAFVGPSGALATLFDANPVIGWGGVGLLAPFMVAGFLRGAIVQGLLKPEWLRQSENDPVAVFGVQIIREEAVDLLLRSLWKSVRNANEAGYIALKRCAESKIASGELTSVRLMEDVENYFNVRDAAVPEEVTAALTEVAKHGPNTKLGVASLQKLISALLNSENWEPLERICEG